MMELKQKLLSQLKALKSIGAAYLDELSEMPDFRIEIYDTKKKGYYRFKNIKTGERRAVNTKNPQDLELAKKLRHKRFLEKSLKVIENDIKVLERALKKYIGFDPTDIYDELSAVYKLPPGKEKGVFHGFYPGKALDFIYKSKSEQIIALILEARGLEFMYEMQIVANGIVYTPDFTIRDPRTGKLVYLEHLGMIDSMGYYKKNIQKLMDYWLEGIRLGENLILTFETKDDQLTASDVNAALDAFFSAI